MSVTIRDERAADHAAIRGIVERAFADHEHADGSEPDIVERLRKSREPLVALVAESEGRVIAHVAFSPVAITDGTPGWFGLGPLSVDPPCQKRGIGSMLTREGLARLVAMKARGCVVLGDPEYYARFGFSADHRLTFPGVPAHYFQSLLFSGEMPEGEVSYAKAFG